MTDHEELRSLLGAYALDALSPSERRAVQRHLESCEDCAREARLLGETAAQLAYALPQTDPVPAEVVDRIVGAVAPPGRRRPFARLAAAVAAVVAVAGAAAGILALREALRGRELSAVVAAAQVRVELRPVEGFSGRGVLYLGSTKAAVILEDVPPPKRGRTYQLWAIRGGKPSSMGTLDARGRVERVLDWSRGGETFAVTVEPVGGSRLPTTAPVLLGSP